MANCNICGEETEAGKYVRAKALLKTGESTEKEFFVSSPSDEHHFYCLEHPLEEIEARIMKDIPPSSRIPIRVVWNPPKGVTMPRSFGIDLDYEVLRKAGLTEEQFHSRQGMRGIFVKDEASLHQSLPLLVPQVCIYDQDSKHGLRHVARAQGWRGKA